MASITVGSLVSFKADKVTPPIDLKNFDLLVKPQDDFYQYANGGWMKANPLPDEYSRYGSFDKLQEDNDKMLHSLLNELAKVKNQQGSIAQKIGDFYAAGMDSAKIEKEGFKPIQPYLTLIQNAKTLADIQKVVGTLHEMGINPMFNFYGEPDSKNSSMNIAVLSQGGLGMSDRDYYVGEDKHAKEIRSEYEKYLNKVFTLLGNSPEQAKENAAIVMGIETHLAKASNTRLQMRDPEKNYNKKNFDEVCKLYPSFDWTGYFKNIGVVAPKEFNVGQPKFFEELNSMLSSVSVKQWQTYLSWQVVHNTANYLSSGFVNSSFEFYGKFLSGQPKIKPRWKRVLAATNGTVGEALGQMFVEKYFPAEAKQRMLKLVDNLKVSLGQRIRNLSWMGDETKQKAIEKLAAIRVKIGYPDKWRDYKDLSVNRNSFVQNVLEGNKFDNHFYWNQIGKPVDKNQWLMTPQTVNAYYSPNLNEICFPAGILQPPFFYVNADDAVNYGAIGVVIGHEITHGFDDEGCQYDKVGNLSNWWTEEDGKRFKEKSKVLVDQFNNFTVLDTVKADGALTLGENLADLGGLNISFNALQSALKQKPAPAKIDGFTPEQRFFLAYAHVWGQNIRDKEILRRTKEDVHSLGRFRVNGPLPNLPEFHKAFGVKPGDPMYLPEDKRAVIW